MWMEFDRVSPLGDERGDIRNAQIVKAVFGAAVYRAQQAVAAARGTEMQIAAEARLAATQERLNRNIAARTAAQNALNSTTAVGSRLMTGALGLVGGVPDCAGRTENPDGDAEAGTAAQCGPD